MNDKITGLEQTISRLHERLQSATRALYTLHAAGNDEMALIALSRIEVLNTRIAELNALLDEYDAEDAVRAANVVAMEDLITSIATTDDARLAPMTVSVWEGPVSNESIDQPAIDAAKSEESFKWSVLAMFIIMVAALVGVFSINNHQKAPVEEQFVVEYSTMVELPIDYVTVTSQKVAAPIVVKTIEPAIITHTVAEGDTLWGIAEKYLGDGNLWGKVWAENSELISDPNLIYPGDQVHITIVKTGVTTP